MNSVSSIQQNQQVDHEQHSDKQLPLQSSNIKDEEQLIHSSECHVDKTEELLQVQTQMQVKVQAQQQIQIEQKKRMQSISSLMNMLHNKSGGQKNNFQSSTKTITSKTSSNRSKKSQTQLQEANIHINSPFQQKQYLSNSHSNLKPKSKFAKQTHFQKSQQPFIITSSHKTFFSPSKKNINIMNNGGGSMNVSSKFLSPNIIASVNKQLTSAGNIVVQQMNSKKSISQSPIIGGHSTSQIVNNKTATFGVIPSVVQVQQAEPSGGVSLYQQVLAKNFQVIDNLLRKLNQIYSHQEQYQTTITQISQKLHKLQIDNQNIHHEFRTSHFMIDKKLNSITNQYANIVQDMNLIKKMWTEGGGAAGIMSYFASTFGNQDDDGERRNSRRNSRRNGHRRSSRFRKNSGTRMSVNNGNNLNFINQAINDLSMSSSQNHHNSRRSTKIDLNPNSDRKNSNWVNLKGLDQQNLGKILLEQINQSSSQQGSSSDQQSKYSSQVLNDDGSRNNKKHYNQQYDQRQQQQELSQSIIQRKDSRRISHSIKNRNNIKKSSIFKGPQQKKKSKKPRISIDQFAQQQISQLKNYISQQFIKMSQNSLEMKKFTHIGIQAMMTKKCQKLQQQFEQKLLQLKRQICEQKFQTQLKSTILEQTQIKMKQLMQGQLKRVTIQFDQKIILTSTKFSLQLAQKADRQQMRQDLKQILQTMNRKVNNLMQECYSKFPQRTQTKRAILFLEKKINKIIETQKRYNLQASVDTSDNVKCLSCNKNVAMASNTRGHTHTTSSFQQPMFTQVSLNAKNQNSLQLSQAFVIKDQQQNDMFTARKTLKPSIKEQTYIINVSQNKHQHKARFTDITHLNTNSINEIHNASYNVLSEQHQNQLGRKSHPNNSSQKTSKQLFMNKIKNATTSESVHVMSGSISSNKLLMNTQQNRPSTSNYQANELVQKSWKDKAVTFLKKEGLSSTTSSNWRSKSSYKRA